MAGEPWIDGLSKALARGTARREALRWMGRGVAGLTLAALLPERAEAGVVICQPPETRCGRQCKNLGFDRKNCGECGNVCPGGKRAECFTGACGCEFGFCRNLDAGTCTSARTDPDNCGQCGNVCPGGPNERRGCRKGKCRLTCDTGFGNCDGNPTTGCEADLRRDSSNCGSCGRACGAKKVCRKGKCKRLKCDPLGIGGAVCPSGSCCSKPAGQTVGVWVPRCPAGRCCNPDLANLCVPTAECPDDGCCDADGSCVPGTADSACGSGAQCIDCTQLESQICLADRICGCNSDADCDVGFVCDTAIDTCIRECSPSNPCPPGECCNEFGRCISVSRPRRAGARRPARGADGTCVVTCGTGNLCSGGQCCSVPPGSSTGACVSTCPNGECCHTGNGFCGSTCAVRPDGTLPCCLDGVCTGTECSGSFRCCVDGEICCTGGTCCPPEGVCTRGGSDCCPPPNVPCPDSSGTLFCCAQGCEEVPDLGPDGACFGPGF